MPNARIFLECPTKVSPPGKQKASQQGRECSYPASYTIRNAANRKAEPTVATWEAASSDKMSSYGDVHGQSRYDGRFANSSWRRDGTWSFATVVPSLPAVAAYTEHHVLEDELWRIHIHARTGRPARFIGCVRVNGVVWLCWDCSLLLRFRICSDGVKKLVAARLELLLLLTVAKQRGTLFQIDLSFKVSQVEGKPTLNI